MFNSNHIAGIRLASQHLANTHLSTPKEIISWMGAMQAQDFPMARWAIGARLLNATDAEVINAIDEGDILRTHLLRPTWHFVSAKDIYWMLDLSAPQVKNSQKSRDRDLELTEEVYSTSNAIIEKALSATGPLTREELVSKLKKSNIATDQNRASHLFMRAELEKIICSGPLRKGKPTYALLAERVPEPTKLSTDEALFRLAWRYFTSRCPATLQDFIWWSGLPAKLARQAIELVSSDFHSEQIQDRSFWLPDSFSIPKKIKSSAHLLPTYDEFTLSYADRGAVIPAQLERYLNQISDRGVFRPIIVIDGQVVGIWKRTQNKDVVNMELQLFNSTDQTQIDQINPAIKKFGAFIGKTVDPRLAFRE